jgi:hypothetical protein
MKVEIVGQLFGLDLIYAAVRTISRLNGMSSKFGWLQAPATNARNKKGHY